MSKLYGIDFNSGVSALIKIMTQSDTLSTNRFINGDLQMQLVFGSMNKKKYQKLIKTTGNNQSLFFRGENTNYKVTSIHFYFDYEEYGRSKLYGITNIPNFEALYTTLQSYFNLVYDKNNATEEDFEFFSGLITKFGFYSQYHSPAEVLKNEIEKQDFKPNFIKINFYLSPTNERAEEGDYYNEDIYSLDDLNKNIYKPMLGDTSQRDEPFDIYLYNRMLQREREDMINNQMLDEYDELLEDTNRYNIIDQVTGMGINKEWISKSKKIISKYRKIKKKFKKNR